MTTFEPGASEVFTHGLERSPRATALRASTPAAHHHRGVRRVGAAGDGGDHHVAVVEREGLPSERHRLGAVAALELVGHGRAGGAGGERRVRLDGRLGVVSRDAVGGRIGRRVALFDGLVVGVSGGLLLAAAAGDLGQRLAEEPARAAQRDPVLRAAGTGERGFHLTQVELDVVGEGRFVGVLVVPQALLAGVGLDQRDLGLGAPGQAQVVDRLGVDREDRAGGAELRRHVPDRGAIGDRQRRQPGAVELDEHPHHAALAQLLGDRQDEVGGGRAGRQLAVQSEAEHLGDQHRHRLAQHRRLGLDAPHSPAEHAEAVDHGGVGVGPQQRVGVGLAALGVVEDDPGEVLEVDLVDDPGVGRHHREVLERPLAPAQEQVALLVALELALGVQAEGVAGAEGVDLDRVVDHQLGRGERVDAGRVAAHLGHRVAHRGEVDDGRDAGEVLQQHAGGGEGDLLARVGLGVPAGEGLDVGGG